MLPPFPGILPCWSLMDLHLCCASRPPGNSRASTKSEESAEEAPKKPGLKVSAAAQQEKRQQFYTGTFLNRRRIYLCARKPASPMYVHTYTRRLGCRFSVCLALCAFSLFAAANCCCYLPNLARLPLSMLRLHPEPVNSIGFVIFGSPTCERMKLLLVSP